MTYHPLGARFSLEAAKDRAIQRGEEKQRVLDASAAASDARLAEREARTAFLKIAVPAVLALGVLYFVNRRSRP